MLKYKNINTRETQSVWERRAPLGPQHVRQLVKKGIKVCTFTGYIHGQYCFSFPENISLPTINLQAWLIVHPFTKPFNLFTSLLAGVGSAFQPTCLPHEDVCWRRSTVRTSLKLEMAIWSYLMRTECNFIKNHCIYHSQNPRRHFWCISHLWCEAGAMIVKFRQKLRFQFTVFWSGSNWLPPKGQDFLFLLSHNQGAERQHGPPWCNAWEECQVGWREH